MTDLTTWLLAQIAAEEERARYVLRYQVLTDEGAGWSTTQARRFGIDGFVDQRRELRRCAAYRAIVEQAVEASADRQAVINEFATRRDEVDRWSDEDPGLLTLRALASIYADADGYDPSWRLG